GSSAGGPSAGARGSCTSPTRPAIRWDEGWCGALGSGRIESRVDRRRGSSTQMTPSDVRAGATRRTGRLPGTGRRAPSLAFPVATILAAALCVPSPTAAQEWIEPVDSLRQIQSIMPRSGPPGTLVEVYSDNMPLEARFHVGVGATRSGFESLFEASQLGLGEISVRLPIPEAVSRERAAVFVAFNAVFSPIAMSRPFHVTDEQGRLRRTGEVEGVDGPCV